MDILNNLSRQNSHIEEIRGKLFTVERKANIVEGDEYTNPDTFTLYKEGGGQPLGSVGNRFGITQPKELLDAFEHTLIEAGIPSTHLSYSELKGGSKILFKVPIKSISFTNKQGVKDESIITFNVMTGYDGYTSTSGFLQMYRLICSNGMKAFKTEYSMKIRNTKGNVGKAALMINNVTKVVDSAANLEEMVTYLNGIQITKPKVEEFLRKVLGYNREDIIEKELSSNKRNTYNKIIRSISMEFDRTGATYWGLVNGITHFTNHKAPTKNRLDYLLLNTGLDLNTKAQKVALEMAKSH